MNYSAPTCHYPGRLNTSSIAGFSKRPIVHAGMQNRIESCIANAPQSCRWLCRGDSESHVFPRGVAVILGLELPRLVAYCSRTRVFVREVKSGEVVKGDGNGKISLPPGYAQRRPLDDTRPS